MRPRRIEHIPIALVAGDLLDSSRLDEVPGVDPFTQFTAIGNLNLLKSKKMGFVCSARCPGEIILQAYDSIRKLSSEGITLVSGFHSPLEKECLRIYIRAKQSVIVCPARSVERIRLPREWDDPISSGKMLIVSMFTERYRRVTQKAAEKRNLLVSALADKLWIAYAAPGSKAEKLAMNAPRVLRRLVVDPEREFHITASQQMSSKSSSANRTERAL